MCCATATLCCIGPQASRADIIILHLRNGDRIAGTILSEDSNRVVLATSWIKELPVPMTEIVRRETGSALAQQSSTTATNAAVIAAAKAVSPPTAPAKTPGKSAPTKRLKANVNVGTDLVFGTSEQQNYYGRLKLTYEQPYKASPKKFFKSLFDYSVEYGETEGVKSANRMSGSVKTDFDIGRRMFVYGLGGTGYNEIRKIDFRYDLGPGLGYHLFTLPKFSMDVEGGAQYMVENRSDSPDLDKFFWRFANDATWKITPRLTLQEKIEFFPQVDDLTYNRIRLESTLSFGLWEGITVNLTVLNLHDPQPASGVSSDELRVRTSLGISF